MNAYLAERRPFSSLALQPLLSCTGKVERCGEGLLWVEFGCSYRDLHGNQHNTAWMSLLYAQPW